MVYLANQRGLGNNLALDDLADARACKLTSYETTELMNTPV